jgi:hypothetical protein
LKQVVSSASEGKQCKEFRPHYGLRGEMGVMRGRRKEEGKGKEKEERRKRVRGRKKRRGGRG